MPDTPKFAVEYSVQEVPKPCVLGGGIFGLPTGEWALERQLKQAYPVEAAQLRAEAIGLKVATLADWLGVHKDAVKAALEGFALITPHDEAVLAVRHKRAELEAATTVPAE